MVTNFQAMGYDTWLDPFVFTYSGYAYTNCNNVVAVKWGYGGTNVYIVGAHYDSVDSGHISTVTMCPGADDNASGTAALLEAAKAIKDYVFRDTIVIVAFDAEEKDYRGSKHFVDNHITELVSETSGTNFLKSAIKAMVNLDTIAYDDTNTPRYVVIGRVSETNSVAFALSEAVISYTSLLPYHASGYDLSDHKIFQAVGIDSVQLIEYDFRDYWGDTNMTENPHNHSDGDSIDSPNYISYEYATEVVKCVVGAICDYAGIIPPATLVSSKVDADTFQINWMGVPNVSYSLYGTEALSGSNQWGLMQTFPATNIPSEFLIQLNLNSTTQTLFKVLSK
ncbi:MAG: M20/M25/M40 family metallo-hydrolase [Kiritimatiellae bacterium]|nr:M20/M25/M40 family metallo-hydrolase [Kiritimatiellia bacterium]